MHVRKDVAEGAAVAAAAVAVAVTYGIYVAHPWQGAPPLNQFLAAVGRADTTAWPMQIVWYAVAVAMVGLALWPARRWSSPLICGLAAAYFAWIGIGYFVWLSPGTGLSGVWATVFTLQAVLLPVAGIARRDLVIRPRWDLSSGLGAVFIAYALAGYPLVGVLGGHALRVVPLFGVTPCATVAFFFGLLLWAVPPAPKYLLLVPLAWALNAAPHNMATGVVVPPAQRARTVIFTTNYGEAGAINNLGEADGLPTAVSGHNTEWWWGPGNPRATTVIAVTPGPAGGGPGTDLDGFFTSITPVATLSNPAGIPNQEWDGQIYLCTGPTTPWAQLWPQLRKYN